MTESDEEMLSAYLDGALGAEDKARVEKLAVRDPKIAAELQRLRANDGFLRNAMLNAVPDDQDAATLDRFGLGPTAVSAPPPAAGNDNRRNWALAGAAGAIAASVALIFLVQPSAVTSPWQTPEFRQALETTPSLQQAALSKRDTLTPRLSFAAGDGRYCREFSLAAFDPSQSRDGIACRDPSGTWDAVVLTSPSSPLNDGNAIEVAGGSTSSLDKEYSRLRGSDPLPADQERELIARHWSRRR